MEESNTTMNDFKSMLYTSALFDILITIAGVISI